MQVEHHHLTIIATDGAPVEPVVVNCLVSTSGERYDFVLTPLANPSISEVFIRTRAFDLCARDQVQELARLIIVDDMGEVQKSSADHVPLLDYPPYNEPYANDIVRRHRQLSYNLWHF